MINIFLILFLLISQTAFAGWTFNPFSGKLDNTGSGSSSGSVGIGTTGTLAVYTASTTTGPLANPNNCAAGQYATGIDNTGAAVGCTVAGGSASAAGGTSAVQYNSGSATFAGDATKFSINPAGNVGVGTSSGVALFSINSSANQDLFRVDDSSGADATPFIIDQTGNVGIGSANPSAVLAISSTLNQALLRVDDNGTGDLSPFIIDANGNVGIGTTNTEQDRLLVMGGNVGIGTWVPSTKLDVAGTIVTTSGGDIVSAGNIGIGTNLTSNAALAIINGNVGIGTWKPLNKFQVNPDTLPFLVDGNSNVGIGTNKTTTSALTVMSGNVGIGTWVPNGSLEVATGPVSIGTTANSTFPLYFKSGIMEMKLGLGTASVTPNIQIVNTSGKATALASGSSGSVFSYDNSGFFDIQSDTRSNMNANLLGNGTGRLRITGAGFIGIGNTTPANILSVTGNQSITGNIGIGTVGISVARVSIVGNVGIGTVANGDTFITTTPPSGGIIIEGNVGIGTVTPGAALDITGRMRQSVAPTLCSAGNYPLGVDGSLNAVSCTASGGGSSQWITSTGVGIGTWNNVGIGTTLPYGGSLIVPSGNVGIGTLAPSNLFEVNGIISSTNTGDSYFSGSVGIGTTASPMQNMLQVQGGMALGSAAFAGTLNPDTNGLMVSGNIGIGTTKTTTSALTVMSGNVGIGTWKPGAPLEIRGTTVGSVKTGANTACTTTCGTSACLFGEDTSVIGTVVACSDATSDICVCLGP